MNQFATSAIAAAAVLFAFGLGTWRATTSSQPAQASFPAALGLAGAQTQTPPRTLTTSGKAIMTVSPDKADVHVRLEVEQAKSSKRAAAKINRMKATLLDRLELLGVESSQVALSHIGLKPVYSPHYDQRRKIIGYNAWVAATVVLDDFERIAPVIDAAAQSGGKNIHTSFRSTRMPELKREVRELALRAGRAKAEQIAKELGIKSMRLSRVQESPGNNWSSYGSVGNIVAHAPNAGAATASVTPGDQTLTLTVSLVYEFL